MSDGGIGWSDIFREGLRKRLGEPSEMLDATFEVSTISSMVDREHVKKEQTTSLLTADCDYILLINDYLHQEPWKFIRLGQWFGKHCVRELSSDDIFERTEKRNHQNEFMPTWTPILIHISHLKDPRSLEDLEVLLTELRLPHDIYQRDTKNTWAV